MSDGWLRMFVTIAGYTNILPDLSDNLTKKRSSECSNLGKINRQIGCKEAFFMKDKRCFHAKSIENKLLKGAFCAIVSMG